VMGSLRWGRQDRDYVISAILTQTSLVFLQRSGRAFPCELLELPLKKRGRGNKRCGNSKGRYANSAKRCGSHRAISPDMAAPLS